MTLPPTAIPGMRTPGALVTHHPHPGDDRALGCPNCRSVDDLVLDVPAVVHHRVRLLQIDGVTLPEVDVTQADVLPVDEQPVDAPIKIRCLKCRWAYTGPGALGRAVPVQAATKDG